MTDQPTEQELVTTAVEHVLAMETAPSSGQEAMDLILGLMQSNHNQLIATMNGQIENLQRRILDCDAELGVIRSRINELFSTDFMPTSDAIITAVFHPSEDRMKVYKEKYGKKEAS